MTVCVNCGQRRAADSIGLSICVVCAGLVAEARCDSDDIQRLLNDYAAEGYLRLHCQPCVDGGMRITGERPLPDEGGVKLSVKVNAQGEVTSQEEADF